MLHDRHVRFRNENSIISVWFAVFPLCQGAAQQVLVSHDHGLGKTSRDINLCIISAVEVVPIRNKPLIFSRIINNLQIILHEERHSVIALFILDPRIISVEIDCSALRHVVQIIVPCGLMYSHSVNGYHRRDLRPIQTLVTLSQFCIPDTARTKRDIVQFPSG